MAQPEDKVKKAIKKVIDELFPDNFHLMVVPGGFGARGIPDHIACVPVTITQDMVGKQYGMFISAEAKTLTGKPKGIQLVRLAEIVKAGGVGALVYGEEGAAEFDKQLRKRFCLE
jgi:phosphoribosylformylglycinamidine (FGAM) synthase-like amidotransferase family enzyme